MPPTAAAPKRPCDAKEFDLGPPYNKVLGRKSDLWDVIDSKILVPGTVWDKNDSKSYRCAIDGYIDKLEWQDDKGTLLGAAPAYAVENGGYHYPMRPADVGKLLPKNRKPRGYVSSGDEDGRRGGIHDADADRGDSGDDDQPQGCGCGRRSRGRWCGTSGRGCAHMACAGLRAAALCTPSTDAPRAACVCARWSACLPMSTEMSSTSK